MSDFMNALIDIETIIVAILGAIFLALYTRFFNWRKNAVGRGLVYVLGSLMLVALSGALARNLGPDYFGRQFVSFTFWFTAVLAFINFLRVLFSYWKRQEPLTVETRARTGSIPVTEGDAE